MSFSVDFDYGALDKVLQYGYFDDVAPKMLEAAAGVLTKETKDSIQSVIQHPGPSGMVKSVTPKKPVYAKTQAYMLHVVLKGYSTTKYYHHSGRWWSADRRYKASYATIGVFLELGYAGKKRRAPTYWTDKAVRKSRAEAIKAMRECYYRLTGQA